MATAAGDSHEESTGELSNTQVILAAARSGALDPRRWLVGGLVAFAVVAGQAWIDGDMWQTVDESAETTTQRAWPWESGHGFYHVESGFSADGLSRDTAVKVLGRSLDHPLEAVPKVVWNPRLVARPVFDVMGSARDLITPHETWAAVARDWLAFLWSLTLWSLAGVVIVRLAVADLARGESLRLRQGLRFGGRHLASLLGAPLIPLILLAVFLVICCVCGLIANIPRVGPMLMGPFLIMPLSLLISTVVISFVVGWPLMVATIGVEDSDAFDGFSHAVGFLTDRTASLVTHLLLAIVIGSVVAFVGGLVAEAAVPLASLSILGDANDQVPYELKTYWIYTGAVLYYGFVASLFWSLLTGVYLVHRRTADGVAVTDVWLEDDATQEEDAVAPTAVEEESEAEETEKPAAAEPSESSGNEGGDGDDD